VTNSNATPNRRLTRLEGGVLCILEEIALLGTVGIMSPASGTDRSEALVAIVRFAG
jgi:hypothetical protein